MPLLPAVAYHNAWLATGYYMVIYHSPSSTGSALATLPLFSPSHPGSSGLDMLAAAASATDTALCPTAGAALGPLPLTSKGPFNPAAALSTKVVKRILDLEFVEMTELTIEDDPTPGPSRLPTPARPPIKINHSG